MPKVVFNAEMKELLDNNFADNENPRGAEVDTIVVSILLLDPNWPIGDDTDNEALERNYREQVLQYYRNKRAIKRKLEKDLEKDKAELKRISTSSSSSGDYLPEVKRQKIQNLKTKVQTLSVELRKSDEKHEREMAVLRRDSDHKIKDLNQAISNENEKIECPL